MGIYLIGIGGVPERHRVEAKSKAQAKYRSWLAAKDAGYRVSFHKFLVEWVEFVRKESAHD